MWEAVGADEFPDGKDQKWVDRVLVEAAKESGGGGGGARNGPPARKKVKVKR